MRIRICDDRPLSSDSPGTPVGVIVVSDQSEGEGKVVTMNAGLVPVLVGQGEAEVAFFNLNAGCTIILAFERREDFRKIKKIMRSEHPGASPIGGDQRGISGPPVCSAAPSMTRKASRRTR